MMERSEGRNEWKREWKKGEEGFEICETRKNILP